MIRATGVEFPPKQQAAYRKARRLEYVTIAYVASAALFLFLVKGQSQAVRTSWLEDMVSTVPAIVFLIVSRIAIKPPRPHFPYGMHSAVSIGYVTASLALLLMGAYLLFEAVKELLVGTPTTIGGFTMFGTTIWAGWPMLAAIAYTAIPSFFLGRAKKKLAPKIHDKVLAADADMMKADWMVEISTATGVVATGFGFPVMDPVAAGIISLSVLHDGIGNMRAAITDIMDETPKKTGERATLETLPADLACYIESFHWVEKASVRMREEGHVFFGEAFVVPRTEEKLVENVLELAEKARTFNWRVHDLVVMPVDRQSFDAIDKFTAGGERGPD